MDNKKTEIHLDVYMDRQELHMNDMVNTYYEGLQNAETKLRYKKIKETLAAGYLENKLDSLDETDYSELTEANKQLLKALVEGVTSERGRGVLGVAFLQIVIKCIAPEQSIRLHKGSNQRGNFSWKEGISMRELNSKYTGKFLKDYGLLNSNKYGSFMTRTLAENYPFSRLYKAEIKGPFDEWIAIVDAIENETMPAELALSYLMFLLKSHADEFKSLADKAVEVAMKYKNTEFNNILKLMIRFFVTTYGGARAFEVVIHGFMQAMFECEYITGLDLAPLSQMRSANKKHGNVGDVELMEDEDIIEAWDAKYGKTYLLDELDELKDKLQYSPTVQIAGFITDSDVDLRREIIEKIEDVHIDTSVDIKLLTFEQWVEYYCQDLSDTEKDKLSERWLVAVVETFALKRTNIAPIEEPSEVWLQDMITLLTEE